MWLPSSVAITFEKVHNYVHSKKYLNNILIFDHISTMVIIFKRLTVIASVHCRLAFIKDLSPTPNS